jgi:hypothetical protein
MEEKERIIRDLKVGSDVTTILSASPTNKTQTWGKAIERMGNLEVGLI